MSDADAVVAAFDLDGTLTVQDCVVPFLRRLGGWRGLALAALRRPFGTAAAAARRDRDRLKEIFVGGVLRGRDVDEVAAAGRAWATEIESRLLRADVLARLRWHQAQGHRTVIVSASLRPYVAPLAASLGIDHVLCTDVVADGTRYTHVLRGPNCRGPEKAVRLRSLLDVHGLAGADLWAYGDSDGDRELLEMAHHRGWARGTTVRAVPEGSDR